MSRVSWLAWGGVNKFQAIKEAREAAEARGVQVLDLAVGEPLGPALLSARQAAAAAVLVENRSMHRYQDNGEPGIPGFSKQFVQFHVRRSLDGLDVSYLPIPGIKPMLGLVPLACDAALPERNTRVVVASTTAPGYPTPADWAAGYLGRLHLSLPPWFEVREVILQMRRMVDSTGFVGVAGVFMLNFPHNPTGMIATRERWEELCMHCQHWGIRIFNDAAYAALSHTGEHVTLADVAPDYPDLSWAEAFSASKLIGNGTGWRIGAMVGSPDFIGDIARIKGNTDSGFFAPAAVGVLNAITNDRVGIEEVRRTYERRLALLVSILTEHGMRLVAEPKAGFFTLWNAPAVAFGKPVKKDAEKFNLRMLDRTGVMGVPFGEYIRYAVCTDTESMVPEISQAFKNAAVSY